MPSAWGEAAAVDAWVLLSPGELIDRITILELKVAHARHADRRARLASELNDLSEIYRATCRGGIEESNGLRGLVERLRAINATLWACEDEVRACERSADFGPGFVLAARSIYKNNDERARIKSAINDLFGSRLGDEKVFGGTAP